jgi:hypothetical protein
MDRAMNRQILNEHDPYDNGHEIVCGCGRKFAPGKAVHLSNWSSHVADLLEAADA